MMYYAKENGVGVGEPPVGGIAITEAQYLDALERIRSGECIKVVDGALTFYAPEQPGLVYLIDSDGYYIGESFDPPADAAYMVDSPPSDLVKPRAVNGLWVEGEDPQVLFERALQAKIDEINELAETEIISGVWSSALGSPHLYDSEIEDQINLMGTERKAALTGQPQPYKCAGSDGIKLFRMHTPEQLAQVLDDGAAHKLLILQKATDLKNQAMAAQTEEELALIDWSAPWEPSIPGGDSEEQ